MSKLPADPRDHYVHNNQVTIEELATLYKGQKGCSKSHLTRRCAEENWQQQREDIARKKREKTDEKIVERTADKNAQLTEEHNNLIEYMINLGKGLMSQFVEDDPATGKKMVVCKSNEYRQTAQTVIELIKNQRQILGLDREQPVEPPSGPQTSNEDLIEKLNAVAQEVWSDHGRDSDTTDSTN